MRRSRDRNVEDLQGNISCQVQIYNNIIVKVLRWKCGFCRTLNETENLKNK